MATTLNMTLLLRRDDFTADAKKSYVLQAGEPGYCTATKTFKVGDGTTTWENLGFANEEHIAALIAVVDQKITDLGNVATDEEVEEIRAALAAAIDLKVAKTDYEADKATFALKSEVATEFAKYTTTEAQTAIDAEQDNRIKALEDNRVTEEELADAIKDFETKENVAKVAQDLADYESANDTALAAVKATADAAAVKADVDAAFEATNNEVAAVRVIAEAARTETEVDGQIDAKIAALNLAGTYEPIGAEDRAKSYVDGKFTDANLDQYTTEAEVKDIVDKVITDAVEGDTLTSLTDLVEYLSTHGGEYAELAATVEDHENRIDALEAVPASAITATQISNWDNEVGAKALAQGVKDVVDTNKATWDLAGTAVQSSAFETFKTENTAAINAAQKAGEDAAAAVAEDLAQELLDRAAADEALGDRIDTLSGTVTDNKNTYDAYVEANDARVKAVEDNIAALGDTYATDAELAGEVETINNTITEKVAELKKYAEDEADAAETAAKSYTDTEISDFNTEVVAPLADRVGTLEETVAAIDTGIMEVKAGTSNAVITCTTEDGVVTVAHKDYETGTVKDAAHDSATDPSFITGISIENGHVTGATVRNLVEVLEAMSFILDGGNAEV